VSLEGGYAALVLTMLQRRERLHTVLAGWACQSAQLFSLCYPTSWAIAQPGGGTTRRLTLRRRLCLNLTIASTLLGSVLGLMAPLELR
jgi:hypothetical protein